MDNIYLIYGNENYLIEKKINEIITSNDIEKDNIIKYDLTEVNVKEAIIDASTVSMFETKKLIICENCKFLTGDNKKEVNHDLDILLNYINNPYSGTVLVFVVNNEKLDERKKIVKELKKVCNVSICNKVESYNLNNYLLNYVKDRGYNINNSSIDLLIKISGIDLNILINELDKIFIYKDNEKSITDEDISSLATRNIDDNIFLLTNSIMDKNKKESLNIYNDLISLGEEPIKLIGALSNQFRLLLQVKLMVKNGYNDSEIISTLKEHPYRIKLSKNNPYQIKDIKNSILKLSLLDYDIKSGKIDKFEGFQLFLLSL